jgi:hypothetical protein
MDILELTKNWQRDGRWKEIEPLRDTMMREARRSGLDLEKAREEVYTKLLAKYPQASAGQEGGSEAGVAGEQLTRDDPQSGQPRTHAVEPSVSGLDAIPVDWPTLPPNAPLVQEIQWVQANRLSIVKDLGDRSVVDLTRAMSPAPSWASLGWLETSIRAYAKFVDVVAKASATLEDERDMTRRERLAVDEIRSLLAEMTSES